MIARKYFWDIKKINLRIVICFTWNYVAAAINNCRDELPNLEIAWRNYDGTTEFIQYVAVKT